MAKTVNVQIMGKELKFNLPKDIEHQKFMEIVHYVESKIERIRQDSPNLDSFKLGLLASINIAEEYFSEKKEKETLITMLNKIDKIITPLDEEHQGKPEGKVPIKFSS